MTAYISLPEICEYRYRVPIIFDNKKSNFSIKNLIISITIVLVIFAGALEPYFYLQKIPRSRFAKCILNKILKNIFRVLGDNFSIIGSPIVNLKRFHRDNSKSSFLYRNSRNCRPKHEKIFFQ